VPLLRHQLDDHEAALVRLTSEQLDIVKGLDATARVAIHGPAGTGNTLGGHRTRELIGGTRREGVDALLQRTMSSVPEKRPGVKRFAIFVPLGQAESCNLLRPFL